ncbi:uncharacterized protein LOC123866289 isoform X2 [Maniola jurtina]|uniref:uncharacterized protein LOC123866289 isoform X2 n=1 Tax=Maniola jurtina TaxID=191418 RepID=UPI001E688640|nr:uncharacterized protein LOC123866289 isoform X2 [Maniola jurtina]
MVAMSYLLVGVIFILISNVSAGDKNDNMLSCLELFNPDGIDQMCCENLESIDDLTKDYEECLKKDSECEDFQCILNKTGMIKDGKIDEDGAMKFYDKLEKDYPKEKSIIERVRRGCLDGKYNNYPPEDGCSAVRFYVCSYINTFVECDSWKKLDVCTEMAENAKKCKKALEE